MCQEQVSAERMVIHRYMEIPVMVLLRVDRLGGFNSGYKCF